MQETMRRFRNYFEAPGYDARDLREWLLSVSRQDDSKRLSEMSEQELSALIDLVQSTGPLSLDELSWIRRAMADAIFSISLEVSSLVSPKQILNGDVVISALDFQIACRRMPAGDERLQSAASLCLQALQECRDHFEKEEESYTSYEMDRAYAAICRVETLVAILSLTDKSALPSLIRGLIVSLVDGSVSDRNFGAQLKRQSSRVSHDLAERMGIVGEHYIARSTKEYLGMLQRAGGAGLITAGTIVAKYAMASMSSGLVMGGALASINYVGSFLLMQLFGFRLATKQPSLTASALVNRLKCIQIHLHKPHKKNSALTEIADDVASIARSQVAAALGNFGVVILATVLFHFAYRWYQGAGFLSASTAHHVLESLNPLHTLTVPFAIFTGFLLWLSTLLASSVESWAIRAGYVDRKSKALFGISSCVILGLLLAIAPAIGAAVGYPIDVRHFTLSTGSLTLAVCSLGIPNALQAGFIASLSGVLLIGIFNFGISFALSLTWSALARGVRRAHLTQVFGMALRFRGFPSHFFIPS